MTAHSVLSASKADRWTRCPGSIALEKQVAAPRSGSAAAREGTGLHALLDDVLKGKRELANMVGKEYTFADHGERCTMTLTAEQCEAVGDVADTVDAMPGVLFSDMRVCYGRAIGQPDTEAFGTLDAAKLDGADLHILDAKFGRKFVDEFQNRQMLLYAIGMVDALESLGDLVETVTLHIGQPRAGGLRYGWKITREELDAFAKDFQSWAAAVSTATAKFDDSDVWANRWLSPSEEACTWCPAAAQCPAMQREIAALESAAMEAAGVDDFAVISPPVMGAMLAESLVTFRGKAALLKVFMDACDKELTRRLMDDGMSVPGMKLVLGRAGNRKWKNDDDVASAVRTAVGLESEQMFAPRALLTPPNMERMLRLHVGKADATALVDGLVSRSPAKPSLVDASHPGEPWAGSATDEDFDVLD